MRPSGAGLGNLNFEEYTVILDIHCQQLGNMCQLNIYICIGYILPTFGICTSFGGFLCALRAQGWGICLVRNPLTVVPSQRASDSCLHWRLISDSCLLTGTCPGGICPLATDIVPKCWQFISNKSIQYIYYIKMNIPQPCARRAHRNPPNDVHSPNVGRIYPIPINKLNVTFCNINILVYWV